LLSYKRGAIILIALQRRGGGAIILIALQRRGGGAIILIALQRRGDWSLWSAIRIIAKGKYLTQYFQAR
jgi:hypothetical protein